MKKQFSIFLILVFVLGLMPVHYSNAITQNQIDAEVQIVCTDGDDNWFSGSGTIIDPKGIILTNRHVIEGAYMDICFIGFIESIGQEPDFGTEDNPYLAEVKYYSTTDDMDVAILYLDEDIEKNYPFVNIWNSNSNSLQFGDKIETIGFPGIGGSTITYTSGDFSGFGSNSEGTQNYIKTTAQVEHGNSGGAAYDSEGAFIGIPTMVIAGELNSLSYILSVNSIKSWLSNILGSNYQQEVMDQKPIIEKPLINIQNDITPPNIDILESVYYDVYDESLKWAGRGGLNKEKYDSVKYGNVIFSLPTKNWKNENYFNLMESENSVTGVYYNYSDKLSSAINGIGEKVILENLDNVNSVNVTNLIKLTEEGTYYLSLRFEDSAGNISNSYVVRFIYEKEHFRKIKKLKFYKDSSYKNIIGDYDYNADTSGKNYKYCVTKHKEIGIEWEYYQEYSRYIVDTFPANMWALAPSDNDAKIFDNITTNNYFVKNLDTARERYTYEKICKNTEDIECNLTGKLTSFLLKPVLSNEDLFLEGKNTILYLVYNPGVSYDLLCGDYDVNKSNNYNAPYFNLKESNYFSTILDNSDDLDNVNDQINYDVELSKRLGGNILLQIENAGEAYYIYPEDKKRYFLGRPDDAFDVMRKLGLGVTHDFINLHTIYPEHVLGKILLDVEQNGEAYYIYPKDKKAYYLSRPADAFKVMRELGLGITNNDLNKILVGSL